MSTNDFRALDCYVLLYARRRAWNVAEPGCVIAGHVQVASCSSARPNSGTTATGMAMKRCCMRRTYSTGRSCETKWAHWTRAREIIFVLDAPNPPPRYVTSLPASARPVHLPHSASCLASPALLCKPLCDPKAVQAHRLKVGQVKSPRHPDATRRPSACPTA